jgi:hypothetical protein
VAGPSVAMHDVKLVMPVEEFRIAYCTKQGSDAEYCRLMFAGKELADVNAHGKGTFSF